MNYKFSVLLVGVLVLVTGCVGPLAFEAQEPKVNESVLEEESYELNRSDTIEITRTRNVGGSERKITVENKLRVYSKTINSSELNSLDAEDINETVNLSSLSVEQILNQTNTSITDYVTAEEIASLDPALTEDRVKKLLKDEEVTVEDILEQSNITVEELITSEELLEEVNTSELRAQLEKEGLNISSAGENNLSVTAASYAVLSSPSVSVAGEEYNPLLERSPRKIVSQLKERTNRNFTVKGKEETFTLERANGMETEVTVFNIKTTYQGVEVRGKLLVTKYRADNSIILAVGAYPNALDERDSIEKLIRHTSVKEVQADE